MKHQCLKKKTVKKAKSGRGNVAIYYENIDCKCKCEIVGIPAYVFIALTKIIEEISQQTGMSTDEIFSFMKDVSQLTNKDETPFGKEFEPNVAN